MIIKMDKISHNGFQEKSKVFKDWLVNIPGDVNKERFMISRNYETKQKLDRSGN